MELPGLAMKKPRHEENMQTQQETFSHDHEKINGDEEEGSLLEIDRISDLSEPLIHYIFTFLTSAADLARLSVLSKRFFYLWSSFPVIDFDQKLFWKSKGNYPFLYSKDEFLDHIHASIALRSQIQTHLSKFRIACDNQELIFNDERLDDCISFAVDNNVRCLELDLGSMSQYKLSPSFASDSINVMRLSGLVLDLNLVFGACPKIQTLSLSHCALKNDLVRLASVGLKWVEFNSCDIGSSIEMKTPNLESFSFNGKMETRVRKPCKLDILSCVSLVVMSIANASITDAWFKENVARFLCLETLIVDGCRNLENVRVRNRKLTKFDLKGCSQLKKLEVVAPSLESFSFHGTRRQQCAIFMSNCAVMKRLSLNSASITDDWLKCQLSAMFDLEDLTLDCCFELETVEVSHPCLERLELLHCDKLVEVKVDAPELLSFLYTGKITRFGMMNSRSLCNATLNLTGFIKTDRWLYQLRDMLAFFGHCKTLTLTCDDSIFWSELIIPEGMRDNMISPLYDLNYLKIQLMYFQEVDSRLVDSLLWFAPHLHTFCITSCGIDKVMKFEYYVRTMDEDIDIGVSCCNNRPIKCWRHYLRKVEMQNFGPSDNEVGLEEYFKKNGMCLETICYN